MVAAGLGDSMGLFQRKENWERTFRLRSNQSSGRGLVSGLFWLWGLIGLIYNGGTLMGLTGSIGMGTSTYLAATALIWIGGMILFGFGALLTHNDFDGERPSQGDAGDIRISQ
jgi:hypothetical protein